MLLRYHWISVCGLLLFLFTTELSAQCREGFHVETPSGDTTVLLCEGVGDQRVAAVGRVRGFPMMYILTDDTGRIIRLGTSPTFFFSSLPPGSYRIYAATFKGRILRSAIGDLVDSAELTSFCAGLSGNYISVITGAADHSTIAIAGGGLDTAFCVGDGVDDILAFEASATGASYTYLVTDEMGTILAITDDEQNFDGAGVGTCFVYGLAYEGSLLATPGMHLASRLAEGCYRLSDNTITVVRIAPNAGQISFDGGITTDTVCAGDGVDDWRTVTVMDADTGGRYTIVVTDADGSILLVPSTDSINFEPAGIGECRVYGIAHTADLNITVGAPLSSITSTGCFSLTSTFITVFRVLPTANRITTIEGDTLVTLCVGNGVPDLVSFTLFPVQNAQQFIITDQDGVVLAIEGGPTIDFDGAPAGECRVYRVSYTGRLTIKVGDDISVAALSDGCSALSPNYVTLIRKEVRADMITAEGGLAMLSYCVGDGLSDAATFDLVHSGGDDQRIVVTNDTGLILAIVGIQDTVDFENAGGGTCLVYGVVFTGSFDLGVGDLFTGQAVSDECFDVTDEAVEVVRTMVGRDSIFTSMGMEVATCPGDGVPDTIIFGHTLHTGTRINIITDASGVVIALPGDTVDFEDAGEGTCLVYSASYTGSPVISIGDTLSLASIATGCVTLSDPVRVQRFAPQADSLFFSDSSLEQLLCYGSQAPEVVMSYADNPLTPVYVMTDETGTIIMEWEGDTLLLDFLGDGRYNIYAVRYTGDFQSGIGQSIAAVDFSTSCYSVSSNFVTVGIAQVDGGLVTDDAGDTLRYICLDGIQDGVVRFDAVGGLGASFMYVITTAEDTVLMMTMADSFDFASAPVGVCRVWGVSYSGALLLMTGDHLRSVQVSDSCFDISASYLTVVRDVAEAGSVTTDEGDTSIIVNTADTLDDVYDFILTGASNLQRRMVITDDQGVALAILVDFQVDFGALPSGTYHIYGVVYSGDLLLSAGQRPEVEPISDGCFDVTDNFVTVEVVDQLTSGGVVTRHFVRPTAHDVLDVRVWPQPTSDFLHIGFTTNQALGARTIQLIDFSGRLIRSERSDAQVSALDVSHLQVGAYVLRVLDAEGRLIATQVVWIL